MKLLLREFDGEEGRGERGGGVWGRGDRCWRVGWWKGLEEGEEGDREGEVMEEEGRRWRTRWSREKEE